MKYLNLRLLNRPRLLNLGGLVNVNLSFQGLVNVAAFAFLLLLCLPAQAQNNIKKSKLKILYVAQNPDLFDGYYFGGNVDLWESLKKDRPQDFYQFFKTYFKDVSMVYGEDYKEALSDQHDVTIFDALVPQTNGEMTELWAGFPKGPDYLSKDYDAATIFIAGVGGALVWNDDSKIDWLCNCLNSHAFSIQEEHPIFNSPYKVDMTKEMHENMKGIYAYYSGIDAPESMPMLRMQNVDDLEGYPPGIVSNPGFGDTPDAEEIASGPSIKSIKAVALGRHGNFFQWGYRASPMHLTESAKLALINTIHYMAKFKGKKPVFGRVAPHRLVGMDKVFKVSDKGYAYDVALRGRVNDDLNKARLRDLINEPEPSDEYFIKVKQEYPDRTHFLKEVPVEILKKYKYDWNKYLEYYEQNMGYLGLSEPQESYGRTYYDVVLDEDLQSIGIANNDLKLLDKCVEMLKNNDQTDLAQRVLERYTTEQFSSAAQWGKWLKKNRSKLIFTETAGFKWVINPYR